MTTTEFLRILTREIDVLPAMEAQRAITYYRELIEDRIEDGMSESEAVASMEDISVIAQQILSEHEDGLKNTKTITKECVEHSEIWRKVLIICTSPLWISLLLTFILMVFSIYLLIWCMIFTIYAIAAVFGICSLAGMIAFIFDITSHTPLAMVELGIALFSMGALLLSFYGIRNVQNKLFILQKSWLAKVNDLWKNRRIWVWIKEKY